MKTNPLGDIRAEQDHAMLDLAFYETPEYRSIIEEHKRRVVVGRRGTGKSALFYMLRQHWSKVPQNLIVDIAPSDIDVIGMRQFVELFGEKPSYLQAACNRAWQYAILQEIISHLVEHYKVRSDAKSKHLLPLARAWCGSGENIMDRLFNNLHKKIDLSAAIERRLATLEGSLGIKKLYENTSKAVNLSKFSLHIVADRLDEGYEADPIGVAILTGLVYALDRLSLSIPNTSATAFLRDNIFRAMQLQDRDYSRNIEGDVLRLHWDEYHLFNMICKRLRTVFDIKYEKNLRIWNSVAAGDLEGKEGFRRCLRLTLFRPRDLLVLLNNAFNNARSHDRTAIIDDDIEIAVREISCSRLDDLKKEYQEVFPGITQLISLFSTSRPELSIADVASLLDTSKIEGTLNPAEGQTLAIMDSAEDVIHVLFSVGFLGIWKSTASSYVFCHDGKDPDFSVDATSRILVHPCYWVALNIKAEELKTDVEEIYDDYDIQVRSETPEIRKRKLGQIISSLNTIKEGADDAAKFEKWCLQAISIVFATGLVNVELHPNKQLTQRRDIVGRNATGTDTWKRILQDYRSRQVVFEVKNFSRDLGRDEYRQMSSYLCRNYGNLGFIINRSKEANIKKDKELRWVREIYHEHKKLIIKLPASQIAKWLLKLRNPQKHDVPDKALGSLLDLYERSYLGLDG